MGLENAQAVFELDIERVFPTHIAHVFNRRILGRSKWDFGVLGRFQNRPSSRSSRISSTILLSIFGTSIGSIVSRFTRVMILPSLSNTCSVSADDRRSTRGKCNPHDELGP